MSANHSAECRKCRKSIEFATLVPEIASGIFKPQRSVQDMVDSGGNVVGLKKRFPFNAATYWEYYCNECKNS